MTGRFEFNKHEGDLIQLLQKVPRSRYIHLGVYLGLNENDIDNQIYKPQKDQSTCLINVISVWLKMRGKDHTWGILASDLREIKHKIIAEEVEKTYNLEEVVRSEVHFSNLLTLLQPTAFYWDQLGRALKLQQSDIKTIGGEYESQLTDIISLWLRGNGHEATPDNLLTAVSKIDKNLSEELSRNSELYVLVGCKPPGTNDTNGDDLPDGESDHEMETMNLALPDISNVTIESQERIDTRGKEMGSYPMTSSPRGYCLIVDNWRFKNGDVRYGSQKDARDLLAVFKNLDFAVKIYEDCSRNKIIKLMELAQQAHLVHSELTCFVVIILTHGDHGILYGTDGKTVSIDKEIIEPFRGNNCPNLLDKPKLFIFQACQGGKEDGGVTKDHEQSKVENDVETGESTDQLKIPTEADILAAYAVPPGYAAWRHEENGSWFIQSIVEAIQEYSEDHDLVSILTEVNRKVAEEYETSKTKGEKKQISTFVASFT